MNNKILIMTIGLPRSGKSTWALNYSKGINAPIVNPDSIRLAIHGKAFDLQYEKRVWETAHIMVNSLFITGYETVILDATNVTIKRRNEWLSNNYSINYVIFKTSKKTCIERAIETKQEYLIPVIEKMSQEFTLDNIKVEDVLYI